MSEMKCCNNLRPTRSLGKKHGCEIKNKTTKSDEKLFFEITFSARFIFDALFSKNIGKHKH